MYITFEEDKPMDSEEVKPTGHGANDERQERTEWCYVETTYSAFVRAGDIRLHPRWDGLAGTGEIRAVVRTATAAPALYDAVKEIKCALGMIEWSSPEHAEEILDHIVKTYYPKLRAALALVDGPLDQETK